MHHESQPSFLDLALYNRRKLAFVRIAVRHAKLRPPAYDLCPRALGRRLVEPKAMLVSANDKLHAGARYDGPPELSALARPVGIVVRVYLDAVVRIRRTALFRKKRDVAEDDLELG